MGKFVIPGAIIGCLFGMIISYFFVPKEIVIDGSFFNWVRNLFDSNFYTIFSSDIPAEPEELRIEIEKIKTIFVTSAMICTAVGANIGYWIYEKKFKK